MINKYFWGDVVYDIVCLYLVGGVLFVFYVLYFNWDVGLVVNVVFYYYWQCGLLLLSYLWFGNIFQGVGVV